MPTRIASAASEILETQIALGETLVARPIIASDLKSTCITLAAVGEAAQQGERPWCRSSETAQSFACTMTFVKSPRRQIFAFKRVPSRPNQFHANWNEKTSFSSRRIGGSGPPRYTDPPAPL